LRHDFPHVTLADFTFWCSALANKRSPAGFVIYCLRSKIALPAQRTQPAAQPQRRQRSQRSEPAAQPNTYEPSQEQAERETWARAMAKTILPPDAPRLHIAEVSIDLAKGHSGEAALARCAARREGAVFHD
jgi:hypothetical protein